MKGIHGIRTVEQARRAARLHADIQEVLRMEREKQAGVNIGDIGNLRRASPVQCLRHPLVEGMIGGQAQCPQGSRGSLPYWDRPRPGLVSVGAAFEQALTRRSRRL